jgi:hypothetical protein
MYSYTYIARFERATRARRGHDVHAGCCPRDRRYQTVLRSVLGFHVVEFPLFSPNRETSRPHLESIVWVLARQR